MGRSERSQNSQSGGGHSVFTSEISAFRGMLQWNDFIPDLMTRHIFFFLS